jgi:hypothetical protein
MIARSIELALDRARDTTRELRWAAVAAASVAVLASAWVYFPITRSYFWADDFTNMTSIVNDGFLRFVARPFAGHNLLVRNLVFYASWRSFGLDAAPYFWIVLVTHLFCVWSLFRVLRAFTGSLTLACFGATLWGTAPNNAGTLTWYSVYGQVLLAAMLLVVLARMAPLAKTGEAPSARTAAAWYVLLLVGTFCFGVGVGVALVFPVVLFLVLPGAWRQPSIRHAYLALPLIVVVVYFAFRRLYPLIEPLKPEEHVFPPTPAALLAMARELVMFSAASTSRSFFFDRSAYPDFPSQVALVVGAAGVVVLLWRGDAATRRVTVAMAVLCSGVYLMIATGRAAFVTPPATFVTSAAQLRYHYVGAIPLVIIGCLALREVGRMGPLRRVPRALALFAALALGAWGYWHSTFAITGSAPVRAYFKGVAQEIDREVASHPPGSTVFLENGDSTRVLLGPVMLKRDFPGRAAVFFLLHAGDEHDSLDGRTVRFVERDPRVIAWYEARPGTPLARLLVRPGAVDQAR